MSDKGVVVRPVLRVAGGVARADEDALVVEEPLEIRVDGERVCVTMRTPGDDARLALGFLLAEGIIAGADDVGAVAHCGRPDQPGWGNILDVRGAAGARLDVERVLEGRRFSTTVSSCGVCGRDSIDGLVARAGRVPDGPAISSDMIVAAVEGLRAAQPNFARTGGLHAAAIFDETGARLAAHEDVGRHNAVDKSVGALVQRRLVGTPRADGPRPTLLAVSGRASFEVVQKAAAAAIPVVACVSAPSSLAVALADAAHVTLVAFVRGPRFNVYTRASRLALDKRSAGD